ncbi:IucA/IucC family C-terminal-domain containing protein [Cupriavidus basilensis]
MAQLLYPVFHLFFAHGVIFEPHLQDVVLGLQQGAPRSSSCATSKA